MKSYYKVVLTVAIFILISLPSLSQKQYYKNIVDTIITDDGRVIIAIEVPGKPPADYRAPAAEYTRTMVTLPLVPAFNWSFGCSATSGAMIAGHYDNMGYPNMYNGPTNNGIMPMDNSAWSDTTIGGENRHRCPLSATSQWLDGRTTAGHVDDYWISFGSIGPDPWTVAGGGSGIEHTHGDCTGDFMKTNQWIVPNPDGFNSDGSTRFYYWENGAPLTATQMETEGIDDEDGCYGMKLFFESRGYTVVDVFNQYIEEEGNTYGFSYNDFKAEIDAGRLVFIHITNHTMVGYGYDDGGGTNTVYIHDTWDYLNHTMIWAGSYDNKDHYAVSCFELQASTINVWNGNVNSYWGNNGNWSLGHDPTASETAVIPDLNTPCIVDYTPKECNNLDIYPGAILRIMDPELEIWNDLNVYGEIEFNDNAAVLTVHDDIDWKSTSVMDVNTSLSYNPVINVYGNWEDREGCFIQMDNGIVDFKGSSNSWIRTRTSSNYFNHIRNNKTGTSILGISSSCTEDCVVDGNIYMYAGSELQSNSSSVALVIDGFLNNMGGNIRLANGTLKFTGNPSSVGLKPNTGDYVNNLIIDIGSTTLSLDNTYSSELWIKGDLELQNGYFDPNSFTIKIEGDWSNDMGPYAFIQAGTRVIFQGSSDQDIKDSEDFNILEADIGAAIRINNVATTVNVSVYDWTSGGIEVLAGTLNISDLTDNSIYGGWRLYPSGEINISNPGGWIDLNGDLHIFGGTMNVSGGDDSYWAFSANASIEMSGGVLDFTDQGIVLSNNYALTEETITGGIIRVNQGFNGLSRIDFNPPGGTFEFYGTSDYSINQGAGNTFHHVNINKASSSKENNNYSKRAPKKASNSKTTRRGPPGGGTRSNTSTLTANLYLTGDMIITSGVLDVSASNYDIFLDGNWTNSVGDAGFIERQGIVTFQGGAETDINTDETFWDLKVDKTSIQYYALEIDAGRTVNVTDDLDIMDGTLEMNNSSILNITDLYLRANAGLNAYLDTGLEINIQGSWYDYNAAFDDWIGFKAGTSTVTFNGSANQFLNNYTDITEVFYHLIIDNSGGDFRPSDPVKVRGDLSINAGDWWDAVASLNHYFEGDFTVDPAAGFFGTTGNIVNFTGTADQSVSFPGAANGYFNDVIVNKVSSKSDNVLKEGAEEVPALPAEGGGNRSMQVNMASEIISLGGGYLVIEEGTLNLNGHYYRCTGNVSINDGGTLSIDANAWLEVGGGDALSVNNGGTLEVLGSYGNEALIEGHNDLLYNFFVNSGGTISAEYAIFEEMAGVGLNVMDGGIVDLSHPFDFCTFKLGDAGAGTSALTINNNQALTISGAVFPANTCDYNVSKTIDQGNVTLSSVSGTFAGPTYEDDAFGRIHWSEHGMWLGFVSIDWNTAGNWGFDIVPDVNVDVFIPYGCPNYPDLTGHLGVNYPTSMSYYCKSLDIDAGGELTISTAHNIYNFGQITCDGKMDIGDDIYTYSTSVLNIYDTIYLGSASSEGRLTMYNGSTVNQYGGHLFVESIKLNDGSQFNGTGGITHIYESGTAPATQNIVIEDADSYFFDFYIDASANASLSDCAYDLEANWSFDVHGTFTTNGYDVVTDYCDIYGDLTIATGNLTINNNGPYFHNGCTLNMSGGTIDGGNLIIFYTGAAENVSDGDISVNGSLVNHSDVFTPTGGTFTFNTTTGGSINDNTQFYDLTIDKGTGMLESGSEGSGVDIHVLNDLHITSGTFELNSPSNLTIDNTLTISAGATLDADDAPTVNIFVGNDWFDNNYSTGFIAGSNSVVTFNGTSGLQQVCEKSYFNTFVIDATSIYVRPSTPGYAVIYCDSMHIENGTLRIGGYRVVVDDDLTIAGNLRMDLANDTLEIGNDIIWQDGSTDLVTDGKIFIGYNWTFENGTSAQLGTGNTVIMNGTGGSYILCDDADAAFGTLDISKPGSVITLIHGASQYDMNVAGDMYVRAGNEFRVQTRDLFVLGELVNEATSEINMMLNGNIETDSEFTLNGLLDVDQGAVLVHGTFELATTGTLTIDGGSFIDDAPHDAGNIWPPIAGTFNLTGGLFEITNYNTSFEPGGTFNISGGTIRNGRAFRVASGTIFQPTGGVVDLTGTLGATAICTMPNYFYDLTINHTTGYRYFPGNTEIKRDLTINGGYLNLGGNELYIGDDWYNNAGSAGFVAALGKVIFNGLNQAQNVSGINTFYDVVDNSSGTKFVRFYDLSTIDNSMEINHQTRIVGTMDVNGTTDFDNASAQLLVTGTFETDILLQGGNLTVTGGNFTAFDLGQDNLLGNYLLNSGTIDLYQDLAQKIDLAADITINNGDFNVYGGSAYSTWPASATTPTLNMSGGTLDFKDQGLWLNNNSLTANISGGLIRTSDFFQTISTNFMPTGGTIEMYGPLTAYTQHGAGSNFYHLKINKDPGSWVWAYSPLDIKGDLEVAGGEFNTNGYQVDVGN